MDPFFDGWLDGHNIGRSQVGVLSAPLNRSHVRVYSVVDRGHPIVCLCR